MDLEILSTSGQQIVQVGFGKGSDRRFINFPKEDVLELQLAYAITIHKSQGSEFPVVKIPVLSQHYNMLFRNLIYTGLTRPKNLALFVGRRSSLSLAIQRVDQRQRQTALADLVASARLGS